VFQTSAPDDLFKEGASSRCEEAHQHMLVAGPSDKHGKQRRAQSVRAGWEYLFYLLLSHFVSPAAAGSLEMLHHRIDE
jgi:hypothetical protein